MKTKSLEKRADAATIWLIISSPLPLKNKEFRQLFGCCEKTATEKMREIQNYFAVTGGKVNPGVVTQKQFREYMSEFECWDFVEIERAALALMAVRKEQIA